MKEVHFRFYAELNDLLPPPRRQKRFPHRFELSGAVKDMIESLGVPHTEVDLILANGESVDFAYPVQDGDEISVYPVFEALDIGQVTRVRSRPLREPRFVLDVHLGKLAIYLRLLGFDTLYRNDYDDAELAHLASSEGRILLTRDSGLLKRRQVTHGYWIRAKDPKEQVTEVLQRFDLFDAISPFRRCLRCNGMLQPVDKEEIAERLRPKTSMYYDTFSRCVACDRIYWPGSHYERMLRFVEDISKARST